MAVPVLPVEHVEILVIVRPRHVDLGGIEMQILPAAHETTYPTPPMTKHFRLDMLAGIARLAEAFPKAFFTYEARRKPLKVGIHDEIRPALGDAVANELRAALGYYCNNDAYLRQCVTGAARIDLEGFLAGSVGRARCRAAAAAESKTGPEDGTQT
jgi:hypothetical protein